MDILCEKCGLEEALYECTSCNKKFCIEDWDKIHSDNQHQKLKITFSVNEKSRELLIIFFEKLKKEMMVISNLNKEQLLTGSIGINWDRMKCVKVNSLLNAVIFYLMKIKFITKKIIYNPIEYFLVNSQVLAEKYMQLFDLPYFQKFPVANIQEFMTKNYLIYDPMSYYSQENATIHKTENLWYILDVILRNYLTYHQYKQALEFLENLKELLMFHKWIKFKMNDSISMIQTFIIQIFHQNYNINIISWKEVENKVNQCDNYYESYLFYYAFQAIFHILRNKKYFGYCSKCILKLLWTRKVRIDIIDLFYINIINFYKIDGNKDKIEKYCIKRLHLFERNGKLISFEEDSIAGFLHASTELISHYAQANKIEEKKKWTDKLLKLFKILKPKSAWELSFLLYSFGQICYFNQDYETALNYLKNALHELKISKLNEMYLSSMINFCLGRIYFETGDYRLSVQKIYKVKEISEARFGYSFDINLYMNFLLGQIYLQWEWLDESLKYFNLVKDSYLKLSENSRSILSHNNLIVLEYDIAYIYYHKGEVNRPLKVFEYILYLTEQGKYDVIHRNQRIILLNCRIGHLYYALGNKEKSHYHINFALQFADEYILDFNFGWGYVNEVLGAAFFIKNYKRVEELCLKLLEILQDIKTNKEKLGVYLYLMNAYAYQRNYEKSDEVFNIINSNWVILSDDLRVQFYYYYNYGRVLILKQNYCEADVYFKKAKDIIKKSMKAKTSLRGDLYQYMGRNYLHLEKYDDSEHYLFKALKIFQASNSFEIIQILGLIINLYRNKNDTQNFKRYLLEYMRLSKEKNIYLEEHYIFLAFLVIIFKRENDNLNGIAYWYDLKEYLKKISDLCNGDELVILYKNKIELGKVNLRAY